MKNKINIILLVLSILVAFYILIAVYIKKSCPQNDYIEMRVNEISVSEVSESLQYHFYNEKDFFTKDIPNHVINDIIRFPQNYREICIYYKYKNVSDSIVMKDVRFYPEFTGIMKKNLISYNSGNGTYYIFTQPEDTGAMIQRIILNCNELNPETIYDKLINQKINMVYFTGTFMTDTGHGYSGIGKHEYKFIIKDVLDTYQNN